MAAAQVAKKLKDRRQQRTIEGVFKKVDKDGSGSISLSDYFGIFEDHGIVVNKAETNRVIRLAGEDGTLNKENFVKIVRGSDFFLKSFDKNKDGEVTETDMMTRAELAFSALDKNKKGYITAKELTKLTKKLSKDELMGLMAKLDSDGDGQLSFDEFKVLFSNADKRRKDSQKEETLVNQQTSKAGKSPPLDKRGQKPSKRKNSKSFETSFQGTFSRISLRNPESKCESTSGLKKLEGGRSDLGKDGRKGKCD